MAKKKKSKQLFYYSITRMIVFVSIIAILMGAYFLFYDSLDNALNASVSTTQNLPSKQQNELRVHYVDVGQADCIVLELPDGKKMLIDAGTSKSADQMIEYINNNVFDNGSAKTFDYVLLTHSDADHCGGMARIFSEYQVYNVFRPQIYIDVEDRQKDQNSSQSAKIVETATYTNTIKAMYLEPNCNVFFVTASLMNTTQKICSTSTQNYYEFVFYSPSQNVYSSVNAYSPIMALKYSGKTLMFTGDATTESEAEAMQIYSLPKVDILKIGHHGSTTSSSLEFLQTVKPTFAVIQVGENNSYGHPKATILNRLNKLGTTIYRTDQNKTIVAIITKSGTLAMYVGISTSKIKVEYLIIGASIVAIYFCFFVKYA